MDFDPFFHIGLHRRHVRVLTLRRDDNDDGKFDWDSLRKALHIEAIWLEVVLVPKTLATSPNPTIRSVQKQRCGRYRSFDWSITFASAIVFGS
jgi:hypothetical protein